MLFTKCLNRDLWDFRDYLDGNNHIKKCESTDNSIIKNMESNLAFWVKNHGHHVNPANQG
jgi:hypothetical protein